MTEEYCCKDTDGLLRPIRFERAGLWISAGLFMYVIEHVCTLLRSFRTGPSGRLGESVFLDVKISLVSSGKWRGKRPTEVYLCVTCSHLFSGFYWIKSTITLCCDDQPFWTLLPDTILHNPALILYCYVFVLCLFNCLTHGLLTCIVMFSTCVSLCCLFCVVYSVLLFCVVCCSVFIVLVIVHFSCYCSLFLSLCSLFLLLFICYPNWGFSVLFP
jgi:hypothetical protein